MAKSFRQVDFEQRFLLPPDMREWVPSDHLVWFVLDTVAALDLSAITARYRLGGRGRAAYDPGRLTGLLLYGYAVGMRSSRVLQRACWTDVAVRVVMGNEQPDHVTIARFRKDHATALSGLFAQVLGLAQAAGVLDASVVAVDSTKVAANAAGSANVSASRLEQLAREVFDEAEQVDAVEDERYGAQRSGDEPAPGWEAGPGRAEKIRQALAELEAQRDPQREEVAARQAQRVAQGKRPRGRPVLPPDATQRRRAANASERKVNLTDPQSRTMKTPRGWVQGYSAQAAAANGQIIVAADVTNAHNDNGTLGDMVRQANDNLAAAGADVVGTAVADRGYWNSDDIAATEAAGTPTLVATARDRTVRNGAVPKPGRDSKQAVMAQRLADPQQLALYRRRGTLIEPIFGHIKINRGMDRFLRRGLQAVRDEWQLICTSYNLTKLHQATIA